MSNIASRVRRHLSDPKSHHRRIIKGILWVSLFVLIGKIVGAAKEMAIAWRYGVSETVDAYVFVFNLVNLPVSVWFSVLTVVLVPLVARIRHDNPNELPRFRGELLGLTLIIGFGLGVFVWFGFPLLLQQKFLGLPDKVLAEALNMVTGLVFLAPIGGVISLFSAWMMACGRHKNTLLEAIPAFVILVSLLLPQSWLSEPLLWGTVVGFVLHLVVLAVPLQQQRELQMPSYRFSSPAWNGFWNSFGIMVAGQVMMSFTIIIDQFFAAGLGTGALSTLSYANRILVLVLGMGAMAISRATLPIFSEVQASSATDVNALALRWSMWIFGLALLVIIVVWPFSHLIVETLFERGEFQSEDTVVVAELFQFGLLQLPFYLAGLVLVSALSSKKKYLAIMLVGLTNLIVKAVLNNYFVATFDVAGIFISTAIMYAISGALCLVAVIRFNSREEL